MNNWLDEDGYIKRLKLLRMMHGETQEAFAARLGIPFSRWNEYERGYAIPTKTIALIREHIAKNITDWILFGDRTVLTPNFIERLLQAEAGLRAQDREKAKAMADKEQLISAELRQLKKSKVKK